MAPRVFDMRKGSDMDRQRFHHLLEAYGANLDRWPAGEREAAAAFAAAHAGEYECAMADARELDMALNSRRGADEPASDLLSARILSAYKRQRGAGAPWRAAIALAACAVFGVVLGYGGGMLAPVADEEAAQLASVFETPFAGLDGEEG